MDRRRRGRFSGRERRGRKRLRYNGPRQFSRLEQVAFKKSKVRKAHGNEIMSELSNDFRLIPLIPTVYDIHSKPPILQKNIVNGGYRDVSHYLDIQFRLMREDFIRPLRSGISEYLKAAAAGRRLHRLRDSFIYHNVRIKKSKHSDIGIVIGLQLDLLTMPIVNWKASRRLIFGSLICFSCNEFNDFIVATVYGRRQLESGHFEALIDPSQESKFRTNIHERPNEVFDVVEPVSYFEAYRYVLKTLQKFTEDSFPLRKYIVDLDTQMNFPDYLNEESKYNFSCFAFDNNENNFIKVGAKRRHMESSAEYLKVVNVLKTDTWPPAKEFGMDESQYNALKHALTREVSVIQGPPGTGKTYIGLRVIEALMANRQIWDKDDTNTILVTCYTNHALDQFMEGIEPFCKRLLRIGGRCGSGILQKYCLSNLKKSFGRAPVYIQNPIRERKSGSSVFENSINDVSCKTSETREILLTIEVLDVIRSEINENQANCLESFVRQKGYINDFQDFIKFWLGSDFIDELKNEDIVEEVDDDVELESDTLFSRVDTCSYDSDEEDIETFRERKFREYFLRQIDNDDVMDIETARQVGDVILLDLNDRWRLYRLWVKLYIASLTRDEHNNNNDTNDTVKSHERLQALKIEEGLRVVNSAKIIGATTTGAAKFRSLIRSLKPKIVIVEEAAQVLESHIITSLTEDTKHLILIGDHIQLQPNPTVYDLAVNYNLNVSLFERLIRNGLSFSKLNIQHRMHPNITELLVPMFYSELENHEIVTKYENILGVTRNVFFIGHTNLESVVNETKSRYNEFEVDFVCRLCKHLLLQGYQSSEIAVITMYSAQRNRIRNALRTSTICSDVRVSAVDSFQGEESDIIICSFVRSNLEGEIGFLKTRNRVNVAFSRAKKGFYAIGNFDKMAQVSKDVWSPLLQKLKQREFYGYELELYCQNHKETKLLASKASDFDRFPEGCCPKPCNKRLSCGHVCPKSCHVYDKEHKEIMCCEKCLMVTCGNGHRCPKLCHFTSECGPCSCIVEKQRYCGHTLKVECSKNIDEIICNIVCDKTLPCGHKCKGLCGDDCNNSNCKEVVWVKPPCGHKDVAVHCWSKGNSECLLKECMEPCNEMLKCEHQCNGTCGKCRQGRLHKKCREKCERVLICGHLCRSQCAKNCPPCNEVCDNDCSHGVKCNRNCGSLCTPCRLRCNWRCQHTFCVNLCSENCKQHFKRCNSKLRCKHRCIGIDCWKCPKLCRICDRGTAEGKIFDTEDKNGAPFVELSKCGHTFEVESLYKQWTEESRNNETDNWLPRCPQCKCEVKMIPFDMLKTLKGLPDTGIFVHGCNRKIPRCGHRCIGICGEECPELCRICDKAKVKELSNDPNARFVQLSDCKHIFEYTALRQWICDQNQESTAIELKCCPICKKVIEKSYVFNSEIQQCLKDIENVKAILAGNRENNSRRTLQLQTSILELSTKLNTRNDRISADLVSLLRIQESSLKSRNATNIDLENVSNVIKIVESLIEMVVQDFEKDVVFNYRLDCIISFLRYEFDNNEQQLFDVTFELNLLRKYHSLLLLKRQYKEFRPEVAVRIDKAAEMFHLMGRMSEEMCLQFEAMIKEIVRMQSGIFIEEKKMVLKAISFGQRGQWFKCPNGHPYCKTKYGSAIQSTVCPECNEVISGTLH